MKHSTIAEVSAKFRNDNFFLANLPAYLEAVCVSACSYGMDARSDLKSIGLLSLLTSTLLNSPVGYLIPYTNPFSFEGVNRSAFFGAGRC